MFGSRTVKIINHVHSSWPQKTHLHCVGLLMWPCNLHLKCRGGLVRPWCLHPSRLPFALDVTCECSCAAPTHSQLVRYWHFVTVLCQRIQMPKLSLGSRERWRWLCWTYIVKCDDAAGCTLPREKRMRDQGWSESKCHQSFLEPDNAVLVLKPNQTPQIFSSTQPCYFGA